jgi:hypothetical protein
MPVFMALVASNSPHPALPDPCVLITRMSPGWDSEIAL